MATSAIYVVATNWSMCIILLCHSNTMTSMFKIKQEEINNLRQNNRQISDDNNQSLFSHDLSIDTSCLISLII